MQPELSMDWAEQCKANALAFLRAAEVAADEQAKARLLEVALQWHERAEKAKKSDRQKP